MIFISKCHIYLKCLSFFKNQKIVSFLPFSRPSSETVDKMVFSKHICKYFNNKIIVFLTHNLMIYHFSKIEASLTKFSLPKKLRFSSKFCVNHITINDNLTFCLGLKGSANDENSS